MRIFGLISAVVWAIPVYFLWNYLAPIYLPELPMQYLDVPFWHIAGIFALLKIVAMMILPRHHFHHAMTCRMGKWRKFKKFQRFSRGGLTETYYHN